jgi:DNA mismatch repair protein MutS
VAKTTEVKETPLMKQYNEIKAKYPGALLLFRVGDFYETFGEDAITASEILGIVLTKRANGSASHIELAGFPHHSLDSYLPKLVRAGQRVAICDQLEDPKTTKTIVKRGVTEMVTPGISYNDNILQHKSNNYLAAIHYADKDELGVALLDISTGEFLVAEGNAAYIDKIFQSFKPSEVLCTRGRAKQFSTQFAEQYYHYALEDWVFGYDYTYETLTKHFSTLSLKGFGIENLKNAIIAAGACLHYVYDTQHHHIQHITSIARIEEEQYMWLDKFTLRNLELVYSPHEQATTLFDVLDYTHSPMGARLLRKWILLPLKEKALIVERQHLLKVLIEQKEYFYELEEQLKNIGDLERMISKVALQKVNPRELVQLSRALKAIEKIKEMSMLIDDEAIRASVDRINPCISLIEKIDKTIQEDPPVLVHKGNVIASGINEELDSLRKIAFHGKDYLLDIQKRESERTGISSLKVSFNNVFGYYLEVTHVHKDKVPTDWIRKQTLVNAERYITPELKEYEEKILGAEEKIAVIESRLYHDLVISISEYIRPIQVNAFVIAQLDVLSSFAFVSSRNDYVKPEISDETILDIRSGRHPIIEQRLALGETFIPNDVYLDQVEQQIIIITGPNMSGKSAILRQTALIVIMAQMGCYVPAKSAVIGLVDKLFTRVGASDNQSTGESTFMVEMNETASILNNLSDRSLVLLDEIGRGTSTYDGISIAWAIAEFIHDHAKTKARTLFATHYHELNEMATQMPRIKNYNVSIKEMDNKIIFLRKLVPGGSEHSFGIHVAKMAGMPNFIIKRGNEILLQLEKQRSEEPSGKGLHGKRKGKVNTSEFQLNMFSLDDPILIKIRDGLKDLNVNELTPVEALMKLDEIQRLLKS